MIYEIEKLISEASIQEPYKHLHHSDALKLLEEGRVKFLESIGFPLDYFFSRGEFLVISRVHINYKREIRAERVSISCNDMTLDGKKILIFQSIKNEKGKIAVEAEVESQLLSRRLGRAIVPDENFLSALASHKLT